MDAILLQTSNKKLRERALQEETSYEALIKLGIAKEQSQKGAALLEKAGGHSSRATTESSDVHEEVRRLKLENNRLKKSNRSNRDGRDASQHADSQPCGRCAKTSCNGGTRCAANGQKCSKCGRMNHFASACRSKGKQPQRKRTVRKVQTEDSSSETESDSEVSGRVIEVGNLSNTKKLIANVGFQGTESPGDEEKLALLTDTGISKTLINLEHWRKIRGQCKLLKTSKLFRPYGTAYHLPIKGKAHVQLRAENGATIETWVYVLRDEKEQSLLGENDGVRLGIVTINLKGACEEVRRITPVTKREVENKSMLDAEAIIKDFPNLFSDRTGKCTVGGPSPFR